jgi:hypothetical protein
LRIVLEVLSGYTQLSDDMLLVGGAARVRSGGNSSLIFTTGIAPRAESEKRQVLREPQLPLRPAKGLVKQSEIGDLLTSL